MSGSIAYYRGEWVPRDRLCLSIDDLGVLAGVTVTERLRTFRGCVFRLPDHLQRMHRSLEIVGLDADALCSEAEAAIRECLERNQARLEEGNDWAVVVFVTPGVGSGKRPTVCVHVDPLAFADWSRLYDDGVAVALSSIRQVPASCWPPELKCRSRMHFYLADQEARAIDPGAWALLLDQEGFLAEATTANLVVYRADEGLLSPPLSDILPGVSLGVVRELAGRLGIPFTPRRLTTDDLLTADEAMVCRTSMCLLPVVRCGQQRIGSGAAGPVYSKLLAAWSDMVGLDIAGQARRYAE